MSPRSKLVLGLTLWIPFSYALAQARSPQDPSPYYPRDPEAIEREQTLAYGAAVMGDGKEQEHFADILLGPHANDVKHQPYDGIRFLYRAAIGGRRTAMLKLSRALESGSFGLRRSPDAARCWAKAPAQWKPRIACVGMTDFSDRKARPECLELAVTGDRDQLPNQLDGKTFARLCLANKTPAMLVFGLPPGPQEERRAREYARHGIQWVVTGDVYHPNFERFRNAFNDTMVDAIDAERGRGYFDKLSNDISASIKATR
jgi:hypothetical protein